MNYCGDQDDPSMRLFLEDMRAADEFTREALAGAE